MLDLKRHIGNCALFLASPLADFISGTVIPVDGGWSLGGVSAKGHEMARAFAQMAAKDG